MGGKRLTAQQVLARAMSEEDLQRHITGQCDQLGIWLMHPKRSFVRQNRMITSIIGKQGYPDLTMAFEGRVLFAELKAHGRNLSKPQIDWRRHLGDYWRLWYPIDWLNGTISRELLYLAGRTAAA